MGSPGTLSLCPMSFLRSFGGNLENILLVGKFFSYALCAGPCFIGSLWSPHGHDFHSPKEEEEVEKEEEVANAVALPVACYVTEFWQIANSRPANVNPDNSN